MATRVIDDTKLNNIAVAIQSKDNGGQMTVDEMPTRIAAIQTGDNTLINSLINGSITSIESDVKNVKDHTFDACSHLLNVVLPKATNIGNSCFYNCNNLTTIEIPKAAYIGSDCFYGATNLQRIFLQSVTTLYRKYIFADCTNLNTVIMGKRPVLSGTSMFIRADNAIIYVQPDDLSWYSTATNWSTLYANNRIKSVSELTGDDLTWYQQQLAKYPEEE